MELAMTEHCLNKRSLGFIKKFKNQLEFTRLRNMFIWLRRDVVRPIIISEYPCIYGEYIDVRGRDLGMEGTRRGRESARNIFKRGARSGQRNAREECKRNRLRVKAGKKAAKLKTKWMERKSAGY
jgi:hypothetical protein